MLRKNRLTIMAACSVTLVSLVARPAPARASLPDCIPDVYEFCINFCNGDPVDLCRSELGTQCRGSVLGGYCQVDGSCPSGEGLFCYVGSA